MPYFLVLVSHVRTSQVYAYAYACAYRTSGNQALFIPPSHVDTFVREECVTSGDHFALFAMADGIECWRRCVAFQRENSENLKDFIERQSKNGQFTF